MRLPTLNVDVKVNTSTMKKDIERANKELTNIGGKGAAFLGGQFGKIGALGGLGGGVGAGFIGIAGIGAALAAPAKIAETILDTFKEATDDARKTLEEFSKSGRTSSMTMIQALKILETQPAGPKGIERAGFFGGIGRGFTGAGAEGGAAGWARDWAENTAKGLTWLGTLVGGAIGGIGGGMSAEEIVRQADLSIAGSEQEARALYTRDELRVIDANQRRFERQMRETTT